MNPFEQHGAFSWCELITPDVPAARDFYSQLMGWHLKEGPVAGVPYTVIEVAGKEIGGMTGPPPNQSNMTPRRGADSTGENVKKTAEQAEALGGKVLIPPMQVETVGQFALIQDPQGATFCVIEYSPRD